MRKATYASRGFRSETAAAKAAHPLVRIEAFKTSGKKATGGASRYLEVTLATRWLIEQLKKRTELTSATLKRLA